MHRQNLNNRSIFALAGENSIQNSNSNVVIKPAHKNIQKKHQLSYIISPQKNIQNSQSHDFKNLIKKLGLARLRKMQALVRGFLVRRTIYPKELKQYLLAQSLLDVIISNVVYREASGIIVQAVTLGHYDNNNLGGEDRFYEENLYNMIIKAVIQKQFQPIARQAIYQTAMFASRPVITYGFNLRDPMELSLYMKINQIISQESKQIAEQVLRQQAQYRRDFHMINKMIDNMSVIQELCLQVANQCMLEGTADYEVQRIINKVVAEGAMVVAQTLYNEKLGQIEDKFIDDLSQRAQQWLLQEVLLKLILNTNQKNQPRQLKQ